MVQKQPVKLFGSQGQKRSCVLALKLAEMREIQEKRQQMPVLILDDITSELDSQRLAGLIESIPEHAQIMMSMTDSEPVFKRSSMTIFTVINGDVAKRTRI